MDEQREEFRVRADFPAGQRYSNSYPERRYADDIAEGWAENSPARNIRVERREVTETPWIVLPEDSGGQA